MDQALEKRIESAIAYIDENLDIPVRSYGHEILLGVKRRLENDVEELSGEMTDKHDFKAALDDLKIVFERNDRPSTAYMDRQWIENHHGTIQYALRLASVIQSGEVSEAVLLAAHDGPLMANDHEMGDEQREWIASMFKTMVEKLMKEVSDD